MQEIPAPDRLAQAVHNNAVWCDIVCRTHGHAGEFLDSIWINRHAAPRFYPNAVTLTADRCDAQLAEIRFLLTDGILERWAVKDSYLAPLGFHGLFAATWLWRSSEQIRLEPESATICWTQIKSAPELATWEIAWHGGPNDDPFARIFLPALLNDASIAILAVYQDEQIVAGAIANRTGEVVGLSNVFAPAHEELRFGAGAVAAVQERFPGLPIVSYESGAAVTALQALGFEELGELHIWAREEAS